jgi:hypothetical protein
MTCRRMLRKRLTAAERRALKIARDRKHKTRKEKRQATSF